MYKICCVSGTGKGTWVLPGGSGIRNLIPDLKAYGIWTAVVLANLRDRDSYYDKKHYLYLSDQGIIPNI